MIKKTLAPRKVVDSQGKLAYSESSQAWNILKLKKELFAEFPELKEKRSTFSYSMIYYRTLEELEMEFRKLKKENGEIMPILLFLYKES